MVEPVTPGTFQLPPPGPAELLRLLRRAHVARLSGYLHITHDRERRGLAIRKGEIVQARSDVAGEHLGDVLVRRDLISQADLERAVEEVLGQRRPLGAVLARLSLVDEARLGEAVGWHVREILFAALERRGGTVAFEDLEEDAAWLPEAQPDSRLSTGEILLEASRRIADPAVVREAIGDLDRRLVPVSDPGLSAQPVALTPTDGFVLSRIDGTLTAREIVDRVPLAPDLTERSLLSLLCAGAIDFAPLRTASRRAPPPPRAPAPPPRPMTPTAPAAAAAPVPPDVPAEAAGGGGAGAPSLGPADVRRLILEAHQSLAVRDHFELLGVSPRASAAELRAAYALLARTLHPDACSDSTLADVQEEREAVFLRVCEAYETLRDPEARTVYERDYRRRKTGPPAAPLLSRRVADTPFGQASPGPTAREPESHPPSPPGEKEAPAPSLEERLAVTIAVGEELLRDGHYWEAIQQLEPALQQARGDLRARVHLALGRACAQNPRWIKRAESHLQDALRDDPARVEAHLLLGDLYRAENLRARAVAAYRRALELQPDNRQALRELARLGVAEPPPARRSLMDFLKKR